MAAKRGLLYLFLYNKWYFDELYDFLFVRPAIRLGRILWKVGDGTIIDGLGPGRHLRPVCSMSTRGRCGCNRATSITMRFAMLLGVRSAGHLVHVRGDRADEPLPILSIITFLPLLGVLAILLLPGDQETAARNARWIALVTTLVDLVLSLVIWANFDGRRRPSSSSNECSWLGGGITYHMGVDGISMLFVVLTAGLMPFCILASWESIEDRVPEYMIAFLALETLMIGVFCALDLVLFYLFFEGGLIPMFLIIGVWGGKRRVYASFKFFLFTLTRLGADAARDPGDVSLRRHDRHRDAHPNCVISQ